MNAVVAPWRRVHVLDLENLLGGWVTPSAAEHLFAEFGHAVRMGTYDQVVIGTAYRHASSWVFEVPWSFRRLVLGQNVLDGADQALIDAVTAMPWGPALGLVLASGDHAFVPLVEQVHAAGGTVELVLGQGQPSRQLLAVADRVTRLGITGLPAASVVAA